MYLSPHYMLYCIRLLMVGSYKKAPLDDGYIWSLGMFFSGTHFSYDFAFSQQVLQKSSGCRERPHIWRFDTSCSIADFFTLVS